MKALSHYLLSAAANDLRISFFSFWVSINSCLNSAKSFLRCSASFSWNVMKSPTQEGGADLFFPFFFPELELVAEEEVEEEEEEVEVEEVVQDVTAGSISK